MSSADSAVHRPALPSSVLAALFVPLWSTGFVTARLVAPHAEPLTFLGLRFVAAGLLLGYACVPEDEIPGAFAMLAEAIDELAFDKVVATV